MSLSRAEKDRLFYGMYPHFLGQPGHPPLPAALTPSQRLYFEQHPHLMPEQYKIQREEAAGAAAASANSNIADEVPLGPDQAPPACSQRAPALASYKTQQLSNTAAPALAPGKRTYCTALNIVDLDYDEASVCSALFRI